jgi:hypothetical protein
MTGLIAWIALMVISVLICVSAIFIIRKPMKELLQANSCILQARRFYLRTFSLIVILATLAVLVTAGSPCAQQSRSFMAGTWWIVDNLGSVLWSVTVSLGVYVLLLTILFAVLGRYHDK